MKGWIRKALIVAVMLVCVGTPLLMHNIQLARDPQLKILREMIPYWNRTESGGIELLAEPPNERALEKEPYSQPPFEPEICVICVICGSSKLCGYTWRRPNHI